MVTINRSLLIIVGLLCALSVTACGGVAKADNNAAAQGNGTIATVVPASTQSATNPIKVVVQDPNANQNNVQAKDPMPNTAAKQQVMPNTKTASNSGVQNVTPNNKQQDIAGNDNSSDSSDSSSYKNNNNNNNNNGNNTGVTVVSATQLSVNGQMMNVLTTGTGLTLYYRSSDPAPNSSCTGGCAQTWPPFLAQGNVIPGSNIRGSLTVHSTANGNQVEYNGHPLYTYTGDAVHEVNGQGLNGIWNAVTVLAKPQHW